MNKRLYLRLAAGNIRKSSRFYVPFLLAAAANVAMFYILCSTGLNQTLPGGESMKSIMAFGVVVVALFSAVFLFYTNSFLIKRRKKELGLYSVLGMEKRHIARVLFHETVLSALAGIGGGLAAGLLLDRLMFLALQRLMHFEVTVKYRFQAAPVLLTAVLFTGIFLLILLANILQIRRANPVDILRGSSAGEREPRVKWPLVVLGVLSLGGGYYIAVTTRQVLAALSLFFVAVLLVIFGTYCLFTAVSIAVLKGMKRRKKYYYQAGHFVSVSGMLYRMKQNAAGLANICILSTMVLVVVSTTVSLYVGMQGVLKARFPTDISVNMPNPAAESEQGILDAVKDTSQKLGLETENLTAYEHLMVSFDQKDAKTLSAIGGGTLGGYAYVDFITADTYREMTGNSVNLAADELAVRTLYGKMDDHVTLMGMPFTVKERLTELETDGSLTVYVANIYYAVVRDDSVLEQIREKQAAVYERRAGSVKFTMLLDVKGTDDEALRFYETLSADPRLSEDSDDGTYRVEYIESRQANIGEFYQFYGSFFFLGLFMGILFLMATVLIIYYKQIIEGYEDRGRFEIMQKVGMDKRLIRSSVRSQILTMFVLPIAVAAVHLAFAFPMLTRILQALNLHNTTLFALCTLGTVMAFAAFYILVYSVTARVYYRIVSNAAPV